MSGRGSRGASVAGLAGLLLLGCGSSASKPDGGASGGGSGCAVYASKFCAELQTCAPGFLQVFGYGDLTGCRKAYAASCDDSLAAPGTASTAALAAQCGNGYSAISCTTFLAQGEYPAACLPGGGKVANGGPCSTPWQ